GPRTGDEFPVSVMFASALLGLCAAAFAARKRREDDQV
ncbi:MAG: LPXTG cell wall anchor domain-containing protein, partial [Oscillospiraceae bacterium]|nr:LPXTG cell wall anchor domain-containing protein [Oscillospiraceae bacterium]